MGFGFLEPMKSNWLIPFLVATGKRVGLIPILGERKVEIKPKVKACSSAT